MLLVRFFVLLKHSSNRSRRTMAHLKSFCLLSGLSCLLLLAFAGPMAPPAYSLERSQDRAGLDVHYVPTPQTVVDKMLEVADVKQGDYLIDLGSGDGRIPITAARKFGTRGMGVDLDPARIEDATENARRQGVTDKVEFKQQDLFETDISKASVLTMYLLSSINMKLRPRILEEAKPGTRVVSHSFDMGDWKPDRVEKVDGRTVYLWIVPEQKEKRADTKASPGPRKQP